MALAEIVGDKIVLTVAVEKISASTKSGLEELLNNYPIEVIPVRKLSAAQNGLIHVLLKQYADVLGWEMKEMKEYLKEQFAITYDLFDFSTAKCDMQLANEFIAFIIEHAIGNDINLYIMNKRDRKVRHILEIDSVTQRYIIACLRKKMCPLTGIINAPEHGKVVELHHWNSVASIGGYEQCNGLKTRFITLCKFRHDEFHSIGVDSFKELHHIEGIWLNEKLVYELLDIYPSHFKLFRKELREGKYGYLSR